MIQLTLTLKITAAQVVETSVTVNNNSPFQGYVHLDDQLNLLLKMFIICFLPVGGPETSAGCAIDSHLIGVKKESFYWLMKTCNDT